MSHQPYSVPARHWARHRVSVLALACLAASLGLRAAEPAVIQAASLPGQKYYLKDRQTLCVPAPGVSLERAAAAGRVRIQAWFRFNGKGEAYRLTPFTLSVGEERAAATVDALAAGAPLTLGLVNREPQLTVTICQGALPPEAKTEWQRLATAAATGKGPDDGLDAGGGGRKGGNELDGDLAAIEDEPRDAAAHALPLLLLERIEISRMSGGLLVTEVTGDRVTCRPGESVTAEITLENLAAKSMGGTLVVETAEGLGPFVPLFTGPVTVEPRRPLKQRVAVPAGQALWGRGVRARIETADGTDTGAWAFGVVTDACMAAFPGSGLPQFGSQLWTAEETEAKCEAIAHANIASGCNMYEAFAWAPCDFSRMTIDTDAPFHSGQTQYAKTRKVLQTLHQVLHRHGIACVTYGKACASGYPGVEYALKHPEQMNVFSPAGFCHESMNVDVLDRMMENRYRSHGRDEDFWQSWISCWVLIGNRAAMDFGCDEIARSARQFAWDGVRYDGHFTYWQNPAMAARVVQHCKERIDKQVPGFVHGYNYCGPAQNTAEGAFSDIELAACARNGGLIMSEYYRNLVGPVKDNIEHLRWAGDATRLHGGYFLCISDEASAWNAALVLAGGARPMGGAGTFRRFATRFSAVVLDPTMRRLQDPGRVIRPGTNTDFRWDAFVYEKPAGPDKSWLIMQLVNVTDKLTFHGQYRAPTGVSAPREGVTFDLVLPAGYEAGTTVFACGDPATLAPMPATLAGGRLSVPRVDIWTLVAVELRRQAGVTPLHTLCEVPLKFADSAAAGKSKEEARADLMIGAAFGPDTVKAVNEARVKITPELLDKVLAQGPPEDNHAAAKAGQPADFTKHRDGIDAKLLPGENAEPFALRRNGRTDILFVRGVFSHLDRLEQAFANLTAAEVRVAWLDNGRAACGSTLATTNACALGGWPDRTGLATTDILVLDDIPATAFSVQQRRELRDYVRAGGSLLVLGGWYSLSKGSWEGSFLEEVLPVQTVQVPHLRRLPAVEAVITAAPAFAEVLGGAAPDFGPQPAVAWANHVQLRESARVLLKTGSYPLLVWGQAGAGRVAVWSGSHSGEPQAPYWQSPAWNALLTRLLAKLAESATAVTPPDPKVVQRADQALEALQAMDVGALADDEGDEQPAKGKGGKTDTVALLTQLLTAGREADARFAAGFILTHPARWRPVCRPNCWRRPWPWRAVPPNGQPSWRSIWMRRRRCSATTWRNSPPRSCRP